MTDNPLVEAVGRAIEDMIPAWMEDNGVDAPDLATAALRAIEDAGWKVVKNDLGSYHPKGSGRIE